MPGIIVDNVTLKFGRLIALNEINLQISQNEILAIIGPNGAGKTAFLNCISGFYKPQNGRIIYRDFDITKMSVPEIVQLGIARTFQNVELFDGLTVLENILSARHINFKAGALEAAFNCGRIIREEKTNREFAEEILCFLEIESEKNSLVRTLPYGLRKRVGLGRALAAEPSLLLLDEPMSGMNMEEKADMVRFINNVFEEKKIPIVLIEHDMNVVMSIANRIVVFNFGQVISKGPPDKIVEDENVINAYLG